MDIESPYCGPDHRRQEVRKRFDVASIDDLRDQLCARVHDEYRLTNIAIDSLRIPYDLVARLRTDHGTFYFKTVADWLTDINGVFEIVEYFRTQGIPFPAIQPTRDGRSLITFHDRDAYLCTPVPGTPITPTDPDHLAAYASLMATIHDHGATYAQTYTKTKNGNASKQSLNTRIGQSLPHLRDGLLDTHASLFSPSQLAIFTNGIAYLERTYESRVPARLPETHLHGDLRVCHALQQNGTITGVLDFDEITYGERLADVCFGLISAPEHNNGKAIPPALQRYILSEYNDHQSLTETERAALPVVLIWSNLVQLNGLCCYHQQCVRDTTGAQEATVRDIDDLLHDRVILPDNWSRD